MEPTLILYKVQPLELALKHIRSIQGSGNYSLFHRSHGRSILVSQTLKRWQEKLPTFVRISQGYLINPAFIDWAQVPSRQNPTLRLNNGQVLVVARRRLASVVKYFAEHKWPIPDRSVPVYPLLPIKLPTSF